jgi:fibronectin-binding autotransporter adhesin
VDRVLDTVSVVVAPAGTTHTWTSSPTQSKSWETASNWSAGTVPGASSVVYVPTYPTYSAYPQLAGAAQVAGITVAPFAQLYVAGNALTVSGSVAVGNGGDIASDISGSLQMTGTGTLAGTVPRLLVSGSVTLAADASTTGNVELLGAAGRLTPGGHTLRVDGRLDVSGGGVLRMLNALDAVIVAGSAAFGGGSHSGSLTAGVLAVEGANLDLVNGFVASGTHKVMLSGSVGQVVTVTGASQSFRNLEVAGLVSSVGVGLSRVTITGDLLMDAKLSRRIDFSGGTGSVAGRFLPSFVRGVVAIAAGTSVSVADSVVLTSSGVLQGNGRLAITKSLRSAASSFVNVEHLSLNDTTGTGFIAGNFGADTVVLTRALASGAQRIRNGLAYGTVQVQGGAFLTGRTATTGALTVASGGEITLGGNTLDVGGAGTFLGMLKMPGNGTRVDSLLVKGTANIRPVFSNGSLSRGVIALAGSATLDVASGLYDTFSRAADFKWLFNGTGTTQNVTAASTSNRLNRVDVASTALVAIQSNLFIVASLDMLATSTTGARVITATGATVDIGYDPANNVNNGSIFLRSFDAFKGPHASLVNNGAIRVCNIFNENQSSTPNTSGNFITWTCPIG